MSPVGTPSVILGLMESPKLWGFDPAARAASGSWFVNMSFVVSSLSSCTSPYLPPLAIMTAQRVNASVVMTSPPPPERNDTSMNSGSSRGVS